MKLFNYVVKFSKPLRFFIDNITFSKKEQSKLNEFLSKEGPDTLLLVANGPSLNETPLDKFDTLGAYSIGLNKIYMIYDKTSWRPDVTFCINGLIAKQSWRDMLSNSKYLILPWKVRFFIPKLIRDKLLFFKMNNKQSFSVDVRKNVGSSSTVTAAALQFAYTMGVNRVVIVGMDHNFVTDKPANEITTMKGPDVNHFSKDYFKDGALWGSPDLAGSEEDYSLAKVAFEQRGGRIYDATIGGKCQVFDKISINDALEMFKK